MGHQYVPPADHYEIGRFRARVREAADAAIACGMTCEQIASELVSLSVNYEGDSMRAAHQAERHDPEREKIKDP